MNTTPLFPLSQTLFPDGVLHLRIFEVRYLDMIKKCVAEQAQFGVVGLLGGNEVRTPEGHETLASAGTMAKIETCTTPTPGLMHLRCIGTTRFHLDTSQQQQYGLWVGQTTPIPDDPITAVPSQLQASANMLGKLIANLQKDSVPPLAMPIAPPYRLDECGWVANRWCELLPLPATQKQMMLTTPCPIERLEYIQNVLTSQGLLS